MAISNQDLRKAGLKVTLPRIKILEILENSILNRPGFLGDLTF